jgi:acetyl esterase/lipase
MKNLLLALLLTCCSGLAFAQTSLTATTPEPVRYLDPVFTEWTTDFGEYQPGYKYKIYMPAHDTEDKRPVMIFYTGGGTTDISKLNNICTEIVQLGYVTVAAQYKLTVGDGRKPKDIRFRPTRFAGRSGFRRKPGPWGPPAFFPGPEE